jgi:TraG/TraD family protein
LSDKFDIKKHKNYKLLEDFNKKNAFDIEEYIKRKGKGKVKMNRNTVITRL